MPSECFADLMIPLSGFRSSKSLFIFLAPISDNFGSRCSLHEYSCLSSAPLHEFTLFTSSNSLRCLFPCQLMLAFVWDSLQPFKRVLCKLGNGIHVHSVDLFCSDVHANAFSVHKEAILL